MGSEPYKRVELIGGFTARPQLLLPRLFTALVAESLYINRLKCTTIVAHVGARNVSERDVVAVRGNTKFSYAVRDFLAQG